MAKLTLTADDGSTTDFFDQAYTDEAVKVAVAAITPALIVAPEATEVDIILSDGNTKKFVPAS